MPNEFVARNGVIALNNSIITGSLNVTAGITGSLFGTASWAQNAVTSSYILSAISASFATSASLAQTASYVLNAVSASFASTASSVNTLNQNVIISGSLTVFTGSAIEFQVTNTGVKLGNLLTDIHSVTGSLNITGSENVRGSGSAVFTVDGTSGRLFSVDDSLSGSLFSVNTAAGLPVVEAFSDNTVRIGQFGQRALFVSQSRVGIGKETALNAVLDVSGSTTMTGSLTVGAFTSSFAGNVGIGTTTPAYTLDVNGTTRFNGNSQITGSLNVNGTSATIKATGNSYGGTSFVNGTWGYAKVGILGEPTIAMISNVQGSAQSLEGITIPATSSALLFSSGYGYNVGNNYQIISVGTLGVRVGNTTQALTIPTSGIVTVNQGLIITGSLNVSGSITTTGTITAQTLVVQTITSSTDFVTGSTRFGSLLANTHQFTGSVSMTGSLNVTGTGYFSSDVGIGATPSYNARLWTSRAFTGNGVIAAFDNPTTNTGFHIGSYISGSGHLPFIQSFNHAGVTALDLLINPSGGNVGIGTSSPSSPLSVVSSAANNGIVKIVTSTGNAGDQFWLGYGHGGVSTDANDRARIGVNIQAGGAGRLFFTTGLAGSQVERMRIDQDGNVGIGTTSPTSLLHLKAASNPVIRLEGASDSGYVDYNGTRLILSAGAGYMGFVTGTAEYMRLNGSGNLGIGTTSPEVRLDVRGTSTGTLTGMALFRDASTNGNGLLVRAGTGVVDLLATWISSGINTDLTFTPTTSGGAQNEAMRITSAGRVGIGTTSPTATLTVSGSATINGNTSITGSLLVTGSDAFFNSVRVGRGFSSVVTNTAVGITAISGPTFTAVTGTKNVAVGYEALTLLKSGNDNTAVGYQALASGSIGLGNTAVGSQALFSNVSGSGNTAVGLSALGSNITGNDNTAVGSGTLGGNTSGIANVALGNSALNSVYTSYNTAVGKSALAKADGGALTAIGYGAGEQITTGTNNTVIGSSNYQKPDSTDHTSESNILSLASSNQPEIWGQLAQFAVAASSNATILSIDPLIYSGAVVDYSLQDADGNQRTSVMSLAFDCSANVSYTDPNQIEQGGTGDYSFAPSSNAPLVDLVLTNNSGATSCAITISCRLLKRYYACP